MTEEVSQICALRIGVSNARAQTTAVIQVIDQKMERFLLQTPQPEPVTISQDHDVIGTLTS